MPDRHIEGRGRWRGKIGFESRNVSCIPTPDRGGGGNQPFGQGTEHIVRIIQYSGYVLKRIFIGVTLV